ncbi:MAG: hypothetical protein K5675_00760 [Lachnospiraceae bacterium]|nr:hypothetical protein [Lachnospiraceae bacterium]
MDRNNRKQHLKKADIILFGAGEYARQFYREYSDTYRIAGCITNNPNEMVFFVDGKEICGVSRVEDLIKNKKESQYIVCASSYASEMGNQLWLLGLVPGKDFCSLDMFRLIVSEKKIALSYGVCYMRAIHYCLKESESFSRDYEIFYGLSYMTRSAKEDAFLKFLVSICDMLLYNVTLSPDERRKHEELLGYLPHGAVKIGIPVLTMSAYYPQSGSIGQVDNPYSVISKKTWWGPFTAADHNINKMIEKGISTDEILGIVCSENFYDAKWLNENYQKDLSAMVFAESMADIKISDYVRDQKGKRRLSIDAIHISNDVICELSKRILKYLGYHDDFDVDLVKARQLINTSEVPLYPSVIKGLELKIYEGVPLYRLFTFKDFDPVTFEEYVRLYCDYCRSMMRYLKLGFFPE